MAVRSMETVETAMETDGDGSGDTAPSRQGAGTETSVPRNSSTAVAEMRNSSGNFVDSPRVFRLEASDRRRGDVRGGPGAPHTRVAWPGPGPCQPYVREACGPSPSSLRMSGCSWENKTSGFGFIQFQEYFLCSFSETQK
jgi:hypothetical protein